MRCIIPANKGGKCMSISVSDQNQLWLRIKTDTWPANRPPQILRWDLMDHNQRVQAIKSQIFLSLAGFFCVGAFHTFSKGLIHRVARLVATSCALTVLCVTIFQKYLRLNAPQQAFTEEKIQACRQRLITLVKKTLAKHGVEIDKTWRFVEASSGKYEFPCTPKKTCGFPLQTVDGKQFSPPKGFVQSPMYGNFNGQFSLHVRTIYKGSSLWIRATQNNASMRFSFKGLEDLPEDLKAHFKKASEASTLAEHLRLVEKAMEELLEGEKRYGVHCPIIRFRATRGIVACKNTEEYIPPVQTPSPFSTLNTTSEDDLKKWVLIESGWEYIYDESADAIKNIRKLAECCMAGGKETFPYFHLKASLQIPPKPQHIADHPIQLFSLGEGLMSPYDYKAGVYGAHIAIKEKDGDKSGVISVTYSPFSERKWRFDFSSENGLSNPIITGADDQTASMLDSIIRPIISGSDGTLVLDPTAYRE
jgi:hypothetical protein